MLKLKLQYFGHLMWRANSLEKILMLGKIEGTRRRGRQRMRWLDGIINSMDMSLSKLWEIVKDRSVACCSPWGCKESEMTEWLNNNSCNNNKRSHNYLVTAPSITLQSWSAEYMYTLVHTTMIITTGRWYLNSQHHTKHWPSFRWNVNSKVGTSLVVQWLKLHTPMQGALEFHPWSGN